jgi:hypothetical protein
MEPFRVVASSDTTTSSRHQQHQQQHHHNAPFTIKRSNTTTTTTNQEKKTQQKHHIKLSRRNAMLVGCFIYFCGISSGSFLCSLSQVHTTAEETNERKADMMMMTLPLFQGGNTTTTTTKTTKHQAAAATTADTITTTTLSKKKKKNNNNNNNPIKNNNNPIAILYPATRPLLPSELKLPTPILVLGLMKAGTTSIFGYFRCGLDANASRLSHYDCRPPDDFSYIGLACGRRMRRNVQYYKYAAFKTIHKFDLYAELDAQENNGGITLPQWSFLREMHDQFPKATWILNLRDPTKWLQSIDRWKDLRKRLIDYSGGDDFPKGRGTRDEEMIDFYHKQAQRVRDFVADHPSHTLVEVNIDGPDAGQVMEDAFGISGDTCWGARNVYNGSARWDLSTTE